MALSGGKPRIGFSISPCLEKPDSVFFNTNLITIDQVNAAFYRDKLIADDLKVKKLYSKKKLSLMKRTKKKYQN